MDRLLSLLIRLMVAMAGTAKPLSRLGIGTYEEHQPGQPWKILLVGYNGARNTGSDVRVVAIARQLRKLFGSEARITVMTMDETTLEGYFDEDVTLLHFSSLFPLDLYRACCSHHAAILCEGSTLKSTFADALTLFLCEAAGVMSRQHKPCLAYGSEVGQMQPYLAAAARRLCRDITFIARTEDSLVALQKLGLTGQLGTDAAWSYDGAITPMEAREILLQRGWDGKRPLLGVAVIDPFCWPARASLWKWFKSFGGKESEDHYDKWYFFSSSPERKAAFERYIKEIGEGVRAFLSDHDFFPVIIGMERLDEKACRALGKELPKEAATFWSGNTPASVMTGILRSLSLLVTSRYHACVLSLERGCPIIGISMDERLDGIMKELSFEDRYLFHVKDEDLGEKLPLALADAWDRQDEIAKQIAGKLTQYKKTLDQMGLFMKDYICASR